MSTLKRRLATRGAFGKTVCPADRGVCFRQVSTQCPPGKDVCLAYRCLSQKQSRSGSKKYCVLESQSPEGPR